MGTLPPNTIFSAGAKIHITSEKMLYVGEFTEKEMLGMCEDGYALISKIVREARKEFK